MTAAQKRIQGLQRTVRRMRELLGTGEPSIAMLELHGPLRQRRSFASPRRGLARASHHVGVTYARRRVAYVRSATCVPPLRRQRLDVTGELRAVALRALQLREQGFMLRCGSFGRHSRLSCIVLGRPQLRLQARDDRAGLRVALVGVCLAAHQLLRNLGDWAAWTR